MTREEVDAHLDQIRLPVIEGGHGLRSVESQAAALFLESQATAASYIQQTGCDLKKNVEEVEQAMEQLTNMHGEAILPAAVPCEPAAFYTYFTENQGQGKGINGQLEEEATKRIISGLEESKDILKRATWQQNRGMRGTWVTTVAREENRAMPDRAYHASCRRRYIPPKEGEDRECICGELHCDFPHAFDCDLESRLRKRMHDRLVSLFHQYSLRAGASIANKEVVGLDSKEPNKRIDIYLELGSKKYLVDFCVVNPWCKTHRRRAAENDGKVFSSAESDKRSHYSNMAAERKATVVPFVVTIPGKINEAGCSNCKSGANGSNILAGSTAVRADVKSSES
jgi:hypothetical protein